MIFFKKSLVRLLAGGEVRSSGGQKIKGMGAGRKEAVRNIVAEGVSGGLSEEAIARKLKKEANTPTGRDKRDWKRVATTEMWDGINRAALEMIVNTLGPNTKVVRPTNPHGNIQCKEFGCIKKKVFEASRVPSRLKGSVHPNCNCGPWQAVESPGLTKAQHPLAVFPPGWVRKERNGDKSLLMISTGNGKWVDAASLTGKAIIKTIIHTIPLVIFADGFKGDHVMAEHGFSHKKGKFILVDPTQIGNAQFYPMDPSKYSGQEISEFKMKNKHGWEEYLAKMLLVMPTVMDQPEYWQDRPDAVRHLSTFMGYKTLADWFVLIPGKVADSSILARHHTSFVSVGRAVRKWAKAMLDQSELRK